MIVDQPTRPPAARQSGTTSWELSEFTHHRRRLDRVRETVTNTVRKAEEAENSRGDAYGVLFSWAVTPFLKKFSNSAKQFNSALADGLTATAEAIQKTQQAYADAEESNVDASAAVDAALSQADAVVRKDS